VTHEAAQIRGRFTVECRNPDGTLAWREEFDNVVATVGKNALLDAGLAGSAYTVTGPYVGLISSVGWSAVAASDTMTSHGGWTEAGSTNAPTYSGNRPTAAWSAASGGAKSFSSAAVFSITSSGTVEGAFLVFGSGASNTIGNTGGVLFSAGQFQSGAQPVTNGSQLNVSYSVSI
jgi:hypothetical protein